MKRQECKRIVDLVMMAIESLISQGKLQRRANGKIPAFISDLDGTVGKRQLLISLLLFLGETFSDKKRAVRPLEQAMLDYGEGGLAFPEVVTTALRVLPDAIRGMDYQAVEYLAREVARRNLSMTYQFPKTVLSCLKDQPIESRRLLLSITGSPQMVADHFCQALKFDVAIGCDYFVDSVGLFTGGRDETPAIRKDEVIKVLAEDCGIDLDESMYMGDTMVDLPGFLAVCIKYRWAINPKSELQGAIRRNPCHNIVWIHDHHATGVQFFRALSD
ncbi:MAG: haloacid dehalogenase-like hydrolase, partial [Patescibacteria group bacterium]|nr:haloacid dehalogenase-like hydrolase [Patescibacteria group bacterium]